jgi:hypothetical protein
MTTSWRDQIDPTRTMSELQRTGMASLDPFLRRLLVSPDDFQLINGLYLRIDCDGSDPEEIGRLPTELRVLSQIWGSGGLIDNGGFAYLFTGDVADLEELPSALATIGADRAAAVVQDAWNVFPNGKPHKDHWDRVKFIESLEPQAVERLDRCSCAYIDCNRRTRRQLADYIRSNWRAFAFLKPSVWDDWDAIERRDQYPPPTDAADGEVTAWLDGIDAMYFRAKDLNESSPLGNSIVMLRLSRHRRSTDLEIRKLSEFHSLQEVEHIALEETHVSSVGIECLRRFPRLRALDLSNTDVEVEWLAPLCSADLDNRWALLGRRSRARVGQRIHRASLAVGKARGHLRAGLRDRSRPRSGLDAVLRFLPVPSSAHVVGLSHTLGRVHRR